MSHSGDEDGEPPPRGVTGLLARLCFLVGAAGLLVAMATDALAVVGRHVRFPLLGSIEIVQAAVVMAASAAMVGATVTRGHATVHILLERLSPRARGSLEGLASLLAAAAAAAFLAGSLWIAIELWDGHERTELLQLPLKPLRLFWCASAALMTVLFLAQALRPRPRKEPIDGA